MDNNWRGQLYIANTHGYPLFDKRICFVYQDDAEYPILEFENGYSTHLQWGDLEEAPSGTEFIQGRKT